MYEEFYGLKERPFTLVPDPSYLFLGSQHKLARAYLEYGIKERMGFVVLTGEVGTGKTTLIKSLLREKDASQRVGVLYQTSVEAEDLLDVLLKEFEIRGHLGAGRAARLGAFNQFLLAAYSRGEHVVLLVDEAQNLGPKALEELRLLSNLQTEKEPLLQVILVGQPGLRDRLRHPSLRQLAQRVAIHYHLRPLDVDETKEYIRYRLARAGGSGIFTGSALDKLYEYTQGVPRRINAWCDLALVAGFAEGRHEIDGEFIELVITAQGGSLEDITGDSSEDASPPEPQDVAAAGGEAATVGLSNGLHATVSDLAARLTRLEGLVLEMTGQVIPVMMKFMSQPALAEATQAPETMAPNPGLAPQESTATATLPPPEGRWSRFWKFV